MTSYLSVSFCFLDPEPSFHGRRDKEEPEWPPSPLRMLEGLVAAAAGQWPGQRLADGAVAAIHWLERQPPPVVVAPRFHVGTAVRIAVPNNDMDVPARFWAAGRDPVKPKRPVDLRTMKTVQPVWLRDKSDPVRALHYLYPLTDQSHEPHLETLTAAARAVTHLGWGVDQVAGNAGVLTAAEADALRGERWRPAGGGTALRVPCPGTFAALCERHTAFLGRLPATGGFLPVPPLRAGVAFDTVGYRRDTDPVGRAVTAFQLRTPSFDKFQAYDPRRDVAAVAAMVRNAVGRLATDMRPFGWTDADINRVVHGHGAEGANPSSGVEAAERFAYLPLPTIESRSGEEVVGAVRRVLVVAPSGLPAAARWVQALSGQLLTPANNDTPPAGLRLVDGDWVVGRYMKAARVWTTVTPVLRPGYDDRDAGKAERLLRKLFEQAGFPAALVGEAGLEWRLVGYRAGVDHVRGFTPPEELSRYPRFHVRVTWPTEVPGPVAVGAGRYRGFGVFVGEGR